jgi:TfoX/Sxy family transcriptional regulator of competence genes
MTAYNMDLEDRIDRLIPRLGEITKKQMFGGLGYLLNGNMCFGIYKESLVLRTSSEKAEELLISEYISPFGTTGRGPMRGWVLVSPDVLESEEELFDMLILGVQIAEKLPPKQKKKQR